MGAQIDQIVEISPARERFFGCSGKMLIPSTTTVESLIETIPEHRLMTVDLLRQRLADQFQVQVTCPVATNNALREIARDKSRNVAYWRVIRKNGELIALFPDGVEGHATHLEQE